MVKPCCQNCGFQRKYLWTRGPKLLCSRCMKALGGRVMFPGDKASRFCLKACSRCEKKRLRMTMVRGKVVCRPCMLAGGEVGRELARLPAVGMDA